MIKSVGLLLLSGEGRRCGGDQPKQFHLLAGEPVYRHALKTMIDSALFDQILLLTHQEWEAFVQKDIAFAGVDFLKVLVGGETRQASVWAGLNSCPESTLWVSIHDAARPLASLDLFIRSLQAAQRYGAVNCAIPVHDSLIFSRNLSWVEGVPDRAHYLRGQTPQSFSYPLIKRAHQNALDLGVQNASDDCSLVFSLGHPVHIILGEEKNHKITTAQDLELASLHF